ncbi:hypothetical protein PTNB29_06319 [Pyrenophora teres f. teres]|nr:hypothetical protein PTNB29_06319 [Pyrenophora teres f. teres]
MDQSEPPNLTGEARSSSHTLSPSPSSSSSPSGTNGAAWTTNSSWRTASPKKASPPKASGTPDFKSLAEGQTFFVPEYGVPQNSVLWNKKDGSDPSGHPVVVVGKFKNAKGEECVRFRTLTSFGSQPLEFRNPSHRGSTLCCASTLYKDDDYEATSNASLPHPRPTLGRLRIPSSRFIAQLTTPGVQTAIGSGNLAKRSYINFSPNSVYEIQYTYLTVFNGQSSLIFNKTSTSSIQSYGCR